MGETAQPFWEKFVKEVILPPAPPIIVTEYKSILYLDDLQRAFKNSNVPDTFILGIYPHQSYNIVATNGNDIQADFSGYGDFADRNYLVLTSYDPIAEPHAFCFKLETNLAPNGYVLFKIIDAPKNMLFAGGQSSLNNCFPNYDNKGTIYIFVHPLLTNGSLVCTIPFLNTYTNTNQPDIRLYSWNSNWADSMKPMYRTARINYPKNIQVVSGALYFIKTGDSDFDKILSLTSSPMYDILGNTFTNADTTVTFDKR